MLGMGQPHDLYHLPILTFYYGKRWYCSWVCGCGALAETAGDPFRQLSSKRISVWKLERWMIHVVLVIVVLTTIAVLWSFLGKDPTSSYLSKETFVYGVVIGLATLMSIIFLFKRNELDKTALQPPFVGSCTNWHIANTGLLWRKTYFICQKLHLD